MLVNLDFVRFPLVYSVLYSPSRSSFGSRMLEGAIERRPDKTHRRPLRSRER